MSNCSNIYFCSSDRFTKSQNELKDYRLSIYNPESYLTIPSGAKSRYDGFYVKTGAEFYKIVDHIEVDNLRLTQANKIAITGKNIDVFRDSYVSSITIDSKSNSLLISSTKEISVTFSFDIKKMMDNREWGRNYEILHVDSNIICIHFIKKTDPREDKDQVKKEFEKYIFIKFQGEFTRNEKWKKTYYDYDLKRRSPPFERFVFIPGNFNAKKIMIAVSDHFDEGLKLINSRFKIFDKIRRFESVSFIEETTKFPEVDFAYKNAIESILSLSGNDYLMAGYPWFYEEWSRDEAISSVGLILQGEITKAKKYLENVLRKIHYSGKTYSIYNNLNGIYSIDALPWAFKRVSNLISFVSEKSISRYTINKKFISEFKEVLIKTINLIDKNFMNGYLIYSKIHETWMDSSFDIDTREGYNIEIQAMYLYLHKLAYLLTEDDKYKNQEKEMRIATINNFYDGKILYDNKDSKLIRPNVFIAYYFYPELLSKFQWQNVFDESIKSLWLTWGGFSTIDKKSELFTNKHTGEDPKSYHRGDSWYFLNDLAAICMDKLDKNRYSKYIADIIASSTNEILWLNSLGSAGELSSAEEQTSEGTFNQAWSNALYIEMINSVLLNKGFK